MIQAEDQERENATDAQIEQSNTISHIVAELLQDSSALSNQIASEEFCLKFLSYFSNNTGYFQLVDISEDTARDIANLLVNIIR